MRYFSKGLFGGLVVAALVLTHVPQAAAAEQILEAEAMTRSAGTQEVWNDATASGGKKRILWNNGGARGTLVASGDFTQIVLRAKGDFYGSALPLVRVTVDSKVVKSVAINSETWKTFTIAGAWKAGSHTVLLEYTNELGARGVILDSVVAAGVATTPTTPTTPTAPDYMANTFTLYNQCSAPWGSMNVPGGTVCANGCGPTATAMVIKNMTGQNVTPTDTVKYTSDNNLWYSTGGTPGPSNAKIGENWGLKATILTDATSLTEIKTVLANGGLPIISGKGDAPYYTSVRHYVVIRGITADNKFLVADPMGKNGYYDAAGLLEDAVHGVAFYKK